MSHQPLYRRLLLSCLLCGLVGSTTGCFYLPLPKSLAEKGITDPEPLIGDNKSQRPIQPQLATRQQIIRLIGEPDRQSADGRVLGYLREYNGGAWVFPLFFYASRTRVEVAFRFDFDDAAILKSYRSLEAKNDSLFGSHGSSREIADFLAKIGPPVPPAAVSPAVYADPRLSPNHQTPRSSIPDAIWYDTPGP